MYYKQFIYIALFLFCMSACSEKDEGCLDILATNFDASADKDCCCTYPTMVLNVSHKFDTLSFNLGSTYTLDEIDTFSVQKISILFSKIHPILDGVTHFVEDTIHIQLDDSEGTELLEIEDNFVLVKPNRFEYEVGTFSKPATYDKLEMSFGLQDNLNRIIPDSVHKEDHILQSDSDSIWSEEKGYFYMYMSVMPDVNEPSVLKEVIVYDENNQLDLEVIGDLLADVGYDFDINITIDYKLLYDGIDFVADTEAIIADKLKQNLNNSISLSE